MRLFHLAQRVLDGRVYIPYTMRAVLGWHDGSDVYCWTRPEEGHPVNQLSFSAIRPKLFHVASLSARFHDRPGLLADLSALMSEQHINIIACRASRNMDTDEFDLEMEIDIAAYGEAEYRFGGPDLRMLLTRVYCRFNRDVVFDATDKPVLSVRGNPIFNYRIWTNFVDALTLDGMHVKIHDERIKTIKHYFSAKHGKISARSGDSVVLRASLVADVDAGVIEATFYYPNTGYRHIRIKAKDEIGTLKAITSALKDGQFSIYQAYHRTIVRKELSVTDLLVYREPTTQDYLSEGQRMMSDIRKMCSDKMPGINAILEDPPLAKRPPEED